MLSFMNMGNRKKRRRSQKSSITPSFSILSPRHARRSSRSSARASASFMSPGSTGEIVSGYSPMVHAESTNARTGNRGMDAEVVGTDSGADERRLRSLGIELEIKHDSLLNSFPDDFIKHGRNGSSGVSSVEGMHVTDPVPTRAPKSMPRVVLKHHRPQNGSTDSSRRKGPPVSLAPIQIPSEQKASNLATGSRRSEAVSQAWASDSEFSPVLGVSAAREAFTKAFAFGARTPATPADALGKEKDLTPRFSRQDSATLPSESVWEVSRPSATISRKSSAHSLRRKRRELGSVDLPPLASLPTLPHFDILGGGEVETVAPPKRVDSRVSGSAYDENQNAEKPRVMNAFTRANHLHQIPAHRISRITEQEYENSNVSNSPPNSGSSYTTTTYSSPSNYSTFSHGLRPAPINPKLTPLSSAGTRTSAASQEASFLEVVNSTVSVIEDSGSEKEDRETNAAAVSTDVAPLDACHDSNVTLVAPLSFKRTRDKKGLSVSPEHNENTQPEVSRLSTKIGDSPSPGSRKLQINADKPTLNVGANPNSSPQSPDILDLFVRDVTSSRGFLGHKRSGSAPSPILITSQKSGRYALDGSDGCLHSRGPVAHATSEDNSAASQTFPETPVLFSPDSRSGAFPPNSNISRKSTMRSVSSAFDLIVPRRQISLKGTIPELYEPPVKSGRKIVFKPKLSIHSIDNVVETPIVSPLEPPPTDGLQALNGTAPSFSAGGSPSSPLTPSSASAKRRTIHLRPPLPFGPRKQNFSRFSVSRARPSILFPPRQSSLETSSSFVGVTASVSRSPEDAFIQSPRSHQNPTFATTPIAWRGYTLDAAKWTFSSSQLQSIVRSAIEKTSRSSAIRLLKPEVLEREVTEELSRLERRRDEIQAEYKSQSRKRHSLVQRLFSLASGPLKPINSNTGNVDGMVAVIQELQESERVCDRLTEELYHVSDQIAQIVHLMEVHQTSALAVGLRKLNASFFRQASQTRALEVEVANLFAERQEAWRKAEELEQDLNAILDHQVLGNEVIDTTGETNGDVRKSVSSTSTSRRSSRVSLARKSSLRVSKAGLRFSASNYHGHPPNRRSQTSILLSSPDADPSERTTFSSDVIPPVPPLPPPITRQTTPGPHSGKPLPSGASTTEKLYHAVYDLLGVQRSDRPSLALTRTPSRPLSAGGIASRPDLPSAHREQPYASDVDRKPTMRTEDIETASTPEYFVARGPSSGFSNLSPAQSRNLLGSRCRSGSLSELAPKPRSQVPFRRTNDIDASADAIMATIALYESEDT